MSKGRRKQDNSESTPVDDVRRVRERLSREAGGDIRTLIEQSRRAVQPLIKKLGLKVVAPPNTPKKRTGTQG